MYYVINHHTRTIHMRSGAICAQMKYFQERRIRVRYHFQPPSLYSRYYGQLYFCNHPLYDRCTLYLINERGLAVIQQRMSDKKTYWTEIDDYLTDVLYLNRNFYGYFDKHAQECQNGLYPTVTIRQIMHALKIKPMPKEPWETVFDRKII